MVGRHWTESEIDTLLDGLGDVPLQDLAARLGRSVGAVQIKRQRIGLRQTDNWLTLLAVARILGMNRSRVAYLIRKRMLPARRSIVPAGRHRTWRIDVSAVTAFVRRYPEQYNRRRITEEPWLTLAREVFKADPVLTTAQAARELGCHEETLKRHLRRGWLRGTRVMDGRPQGRWLIRRSQLASYRGRQGEHVRRRKEPCDS